MDVEQNSKNDLPKVNFHILQGWKIQEGMQLRSVRQSRGFDRTDLMGKKLLHPLFG
jgi:ribosomal protein S12